MATLDQLAQQGDPGTLRTDQQAGALRLMDPQQLYELWERQHWSAHAIDLSRDAEDYARLSPEAREQLIWSLSSFFIGEERVTTQFSGLVMSYENESEASYLATQQVDEARHMQFFDRFYREVVAIEGADFEARLARVREELNDAFTRLFDDALVEAGRRLVADPGDREAKVDFVTTYHMVIEGTLALTGQHYVTDWLENADLMPGFREGFGLVAQDEHRHVAYGTWYLQQTAGRDPLLAERMRRCLHDLIPVAAGVLVPVGVDPTEDWEVLGYTSEEINGFAFRSLSRRLKAIGVPLVAAAA